MSDPILSCESPLKPHKDPITGIWECAVPGGDVGAVTVSASDDDEIMEIPTFSFLDEKPKIQKRHTVDPRFIKAYAAAWVLVRSGGKCGQFFGNGADKLIDDMFSRAVPGVVRDENGYIDENVGIDMQNAIGIVDSSGKTMYDQYQKITINEKGPFLNKFSTANRNDLGGYNHGTVQSQTLQVLHELGHIMYKSGSPLLLTPDGGGKRNADGKLISVQNTQTILEHCRKEIERLLGKI